MNSEVYKRKVNGRDELLLRVLDAAARLNNMKVSWDKQYAILPHKLQSLLRLMVRFSKIYFTDLTIFSFLCNEFVI
jgi:hypothetical protein